MLYNEILLPRYGNLTMGKLKSSHWIVIMFNEMYTKHMCMKEGLWKVSKRIVNATQPFVKLSDMSKVYRNKTVDNISCKTIHVNGRHFLFIDSMISWNDAHEQASHKFIAIIVKVYFLNIYISWMIISLLPFDVNISRHQQHLKVSKPKRLSNEKIKPFSCKDLYHSSPMTTQEQQYPNQCPDTHCVYII
jgi:hypothetical protein